MDRECAGRHALGHRPRDTKVTATLDAKTFGANRLKFTPDGKLVLISSLGRRRSGHLRCSVAQGIQAGADRPWSGGHSDGSDGNRAFIACGPDNYVAVVDLKTL